MLLCSNDSNDIIKALSFLKKLSQSETDSTNIIDYISKNTDLISHLKRILKLSEEVDIIVFILNIIFKTVFDLFYFHKLCL